MKAFLIFNGYKISVRQKIGFKNTFACDIGLEEGTVTIWLTKWVFYVVGKKIEATQYLSSTCFYSGLRKLMNETLL